MTKPNELPEGHYKAFTLPTGREVRVWGNMVIEAKDGGEWRIVNEKKHPGFASKILEELLERWDEIPTQKGDASGGVRTGQVAS